MTLSPVPENFQSRSVRVGSAYEKQVVAGLEQHGWTIKARKWREPIVDIEIDIVAIDPTGNEVWIECKGSLDGDRAGARRTDSTKKFIADAALLYAMYPEDERPDYLLITSDLPSSGAAFKQLEAARAQGWCRLAEFAMRIRFLD